MSQAMIIGTIIIVTLIVAVGVKIWIQQLIRFKMDESDIMKQLENEPLSAEALAAATGINESRIAVACDKSQAIYPVSRDSPLWQTAQTPTPEQN